MFARKAKNSDVQSSLQKFSDLARECSSRAKHFKMAMDVLCAQEKRQFLAEYHFEIFHLIDSILLSLDLSVDAQGVVEAESALWALEQVLCYAPELVGKGWQRYAIENILKRALHPRNLLAVRKIAVRLFLTWYQTLAVYQGTDASLDMVFQNLLPYFPLRSREPTMKTLQMYCEGTRTTDLHHSNGHHQNGFDPRPPVITPIVSNPTPMEQLSARERAQTLQIYLDKFLEYVNREATKIEWQEDQCRVQAVRFLTEKVIQLYIYEVFDDIDSNGVDVFEGWEGSEQNKEMMDTADPLTIARYWLIRWITNIASASLVDDPPAGAMLFRSILFSNPKAINCLLTLMREAMQLPLACSSVIHKVLFLVRSWLLQIELPPFLDPNQSPTSRNAKVSLDYANILLIDFCTCFFRSPYLAASGDRLPTAINLTQTVLDIFRDLANPTVTQLTRPLGQNVWNELLKKLTKSVEFCTSKSDAYSSSTAGLFTRALLTICVFVRVIRQVEVDERMWDNVWMVFRSAIWTQTIEQWSKFVEILTKALILNLFDTDSSSQFTGDNNSTGSVEPVSRRRALSRPDFMAVVPDGEATDITSEPPPTTNSNNGSSIPDRPQLDRDTNAIMQRTGQDEDWLRCWMRVVSLVSASDPRHTKQAVQTLGRSIELLLGVCGGQALAQWLGDQLLDGCERIASQQPHAIGAICAVLSHAQPTDKQRSRILVQLLDCLRVDEVAPIVLEHFPQMNVEDMAVVSSDTIKTLQTLVRNSEFSSRAVRVAALLSMSHPDAEKILLSILSSSQIEVDLSSLVLCVNALSILILERADVPLLKTVMDLLLKHREHSSTLMSLYCANLGCAPRLGFHCRLAEALESAITHSNPQRDTRFVNEFKWQFVSLYAKDRVCKSLKPLLAALGAGNDSFLEGLMIEKSLQFPLPGFSISQWNSFCSKDAPNKNESIMINSGHALLNFEKTQVNNHSSLLWSRTVVGKHCFLVDKLGGIPTSETPAQRWLDSLIEEQKQSPKKLFAEDEQHSVEASDPFVDELLTRNRPPSQNSISSALSSVSSQDISDVLQVLKHSRRQPSGLNTSNEPIEDEETKQSEQIVQSSPWPWRQFAADLHLFSKTRQAVSADSFARDLRHLDGTCSRELHKVAVIYVAKGQEDKQSILSNTTASANFDEFVAGLGWPVKIGAETHSGYTGGLSVDHIAPYYANASCELIFHVSTRLMGDPTQKLKHLGNDEVHVVWTEHTHQYRREIIATRFCDVLIVLQPVSIALVRVRIETQQAGVHFGPLFDGCQIHIKEVPALVRETVLNASRSYRVSQQNIVRPNKHREQVFSNTRSHLSYLNIGPAITNVYLPSLKS
ncbi:hypothetical protein M3Y97_00409700 [Aphelenchoides bicaudatus]|nr:hypothetical protein M3Y97_00409700 [Aphelenchoides bicaudatus]